MRNVYIINPKAGKHDHTVQFMERIRAVHATHEEEPEIYLTQRAGHGEELARAAAEKGDAVRIWAVGGDGTVLEVVRGAEFHKNAAVGVYPCGSGNDFVRSFGKREVFLNPENQLAGKTVSIDMIRTQHGDAVNICSVGFDAKVAAEMNYYKHLPFVSGELAYTISLAKCFLGHLADKMTVTFLLCGRHKRDRYGRISVHACGQRPLVWRRVLRRAELGDRRRSARFCADPKARLFPHSGPCAEV